MECAISRRVASTYLRRLRASRVDNIPRSSDAFGFEGPGADKLTSELITHLKRLHVEARSNAAAGWGTMAGLLLKHTSLDADPVTSRTALSEPLRMLYLGLADEVDEYFQDL